MIKSLNDSHFKFDLTAYDPDHDSLSYELDTCRSTGGLNIPGYYIPAGVSLNPYNGEFTWDGTTSVQGLYCFAIKITKWRQGRKVGYVLTDFQLTNIVTSSVSYSFIGTNSFINSDTLGSNYIVMNPNDTLNLQITFTDSNTSNLTVMQSFSEVYTLNYPASFSSDTTMNISKGYFTWIPKSEYGRKRPYLLTFRGYATTNIAEISNDLSLFIYVAGDNDTVCPSFPINYSANTYNYIVVFPIPATNEIEIISRQYALSSIEIFNMLGEKIYASLPTHYLTLYPINISAFPSGMYFAKIKSPEGVTIRKFLKE
jgi:hypothetical protein